jgi:hypothetical protein
MKPSPLALIPAYSHIDRRLLEALRRVGIPYMDVHGCSDLVRARSGLLSDALRTDADRFLFIDSDIVPSCDDLIRLLESPKLDPGNAVSGCYVVAPGRLAAQAEADQIEVGGAERFVPMLAAGMGFAAVHRSAVEVLKQQLPELVDNKSRVWHPYFLPVVVQQETEIGLLQEYLSEDFAFWWRLRLSGIKLWIDTHLTVGHIKSTILTPSGGEDGGNYVLSKVHARAAE